LGSDARYLAGKFQAYARQKIARENDWSQRLAELAKLCDELGTACKYESYEQMELARRTKATTEEVKKEIVDTREFNPADVRAAIAIQLNMIVHELKDLDVRSTSLVESSRIEELQGKTKDLGTSLLRLAHYAVVLPEPQPERLFAIARRLCEAGKRPLEMDGGATEREIVASIHEGGEEIEAFLEKLG
jgi:hypothetical protein